MQAIRLFCFQLITYVRLSVIYDLEKIIKNNFENCVLYLRQLFGFPNLNTHFLFISIVNVIIISTKTLLLLISNTVRVQIYNLY